MDTQNKKIKTINFSMLRLFNLIDDSLADDVVPFIYELLPVAADPILAICFDQLRNSDAEDLEFFFRSRYILGSQKFKNGFQGKHRHHYLNKQRTPSFSLKNGVLFAGFMAIPQTGFAFLVSSIIG